WNATNYLRQSSSAEVGSSVSGAGEVRINAQNDLSLRAAQVNAQGALSVSAGGNVVIEAGQSADSLAEARQVKSSGLLSSKTTTTRSSSQSTTAQGSELGGQTLSIKAGQDLNISGSSVIADQDLSIQAGQNLSIQAAQNTQGASSFNETRRSGLMSSGLSITVGKQQQSLDQQNTQTTAAASTVGSVGGNVSLSAGNTYTQTGSDVLSPAGNIDISAQSVNIQEARETSDQSSEQKFKQSGLTLAITSPVITALQTANSQLQAAGNTSSSRMQALAGANAAFNVKQAADAIGAGQAKADGNAADQAGGVGISISLGASKSQSTQSSSTDSARGSTVQAGGNVSIAATGAGKESDLTLQGSSVQAGGTTTLQADDAVNILAAAHTSSEANSSKNSSGSIGIGFQLGAGGASAGVSVSAAAGKGQGAGSGTSYSNSQVSGQQVLIESGGDTTIQGGVVRGEQVTANVGGNLLIESLQDTSRYNETSKSAGGSVTFGPAPGGSVNLAKSNINSTYQSVTEQSAIRAGDGGFQVNVQGNTELVGGAITSTQAAIDQNNSFQTGGTLTTTDLQNSASYQANSAGIGISTSGGKVAPSGVGFGSDKGDASSTTVAAISGLAGNTAARTGDAEAGIGQIFDKDRVQKEVAAQVTITAEFGKHASKAVGDYAKGKLEEAQRNNDPSGIEAWREGGAARVALHVAVGGLTGGAAGAVGAGAASAAAPAIEQLQGQLQEGLQNAGLGDSASQLIASLAGGATAAGIGAAASGGTLAGGATAFNADMNNRQLHPSEAQIIKDNARRFARQLYGTDQPTAAQIEAAQALLANTAQNQLDNNLGATVPYNETANAFLQTLKIEYQQANGTLILPGTSGQPTGAQQLFFANTEQKNQPWLNQGLADPTVTGLIVRTPINPPKAGEVVPANRDRMTGLPLDEKGRYEVQVTLDGKGFSPKYHSCASAACINRNANLDMSDSATQAYVRALDQKVFKDIGTGATLGSLVTPVGVPGAVLGLVGLAAGGGGAALSERPTEAAFDESLKVASEKGGEKFFTEVLGHTPGAAARASALIELSGGWDAFVNRVKIDVFGMKPNDTKN
ncbi:hemagglutinin repeat-containing protein, partial [Hydrogenophaga sp.]|uniref:hemagglutinin repeat-containing protein n=1 Tax=Hydrogenophaga sp. TaxID=1904254 RepID=UPI003F6AC84B